MSSTRLWARHLCSSSARVIGWSRLSRSTFVYGRPTLRPFGQLFAQQLRAAPNVCFAHASFSTMSSNDPIEYDWIAGVERLDMYELGGYHPVKIDDLLHSRYQIVDKLGYGGYSTIWLARDQQGNRYVAIKIGVSSDGTVQSESATLNSINGAILKNNIVSPSWSQDLIPTILDEFTIRGPNGTHPCYVVAPAQGNLREASFSQLFSKPVARALAARLALAVNLVRSNGFVHGGKINASSTYIHLRNILIKLPSSFDELSVDEFRKKHGEPETEPIHRTDGKPLTTGVPRNAVYPLYLGKQAPDFTLDDAKGLMLSDFGEAFHPASQPRCGKDCKTPLARQPPEVFWEPERLLSYPSDVWGLGTAIWEILGMKYIFSESETRDEIAAQQVDVLGAENFPVEWRKLWDRSPDDDNKNAEYTLPRRPDYERETWPTLEKAFEEFVQKYRRKQEALGVFDAEETRAIIDLMRGMLQFRPEKRLTIGEVLKSEWMTKYALPQLEEKGHRVKET